MKNQTFTNLLLDEATRKLSVPNNILREISNEAFEFIQLYLIAVMGSLLALFGMASNLIIVVVFYKQTVKDSITVSYITLAIWDASLSLLTLLTIMCLVIENYFPLPYVDFYYVQIVYVAYTRSVTHMLSTFVTVYMSVELCFCIMIPLKVKLMFTKTRSVIFNFCLFVVSIILNCPQWTIQGMSWQYNPRFNHSRLTISYSAGRYEVDVYFGINNGNIIPISGQIISIICASLLIAGINKSVRFKIQTTVNIPEQTKNSKNFPDGIAERNRSTVRKKLRTSQTAIGKYIKLAKVTALLTVIFLVCNVPVIVVALSRTIVPAINTNVKILGVVYYVVYASTLVNSSANILVYYYANEKFRKTLLAMVFGNVHYCSRNKMQTEKKS